MKSRVIFGINGEAAFLDEDSKQVPELQKPWLLLYVEFLESKGIDPTDVEFDMPGRLDRAEVFKTAEGYNWRFK